MKKNKLSLIRQAQIAECGHACVAMIANYHGHQLDLHALRELKEPSINGSTLLDLIALLEQLQCTTRALRLDLQDLSCLSLPAIIHWNMNHFVVLESINAKQAVIYDPASGKRTISLAELSTSFTGIALEIEKSQDFQVIKTNNKLNILSIFKQVSGLKHSLILLLLLSLAIELFVLINPLFLQYITDNVSENSQLTNLYVIAAGFILITLCHSFTEYMRSHFVVYLTNNLADYFSSGLMKHLLKLPFEYFERRHKGDILSRFHSINEIQSKITTDSINTLLDGLVILLALSIMFLYSPLLACLVLVSLSIYLGLRIVSYQHLKNQTAISIGEHAAVNSKFLEIIQSIMSIKLYAKEATLYRDWKNCFIKGMNADIQIARANLIYSTATILLFNIEHILVLVLGALLVIHKQFSLGMLIAFLAYRQTLVSKAGSFIQKLFEYKLIAIQIDRVADILIQPAEQDSDKTLVKATIQGDIKVNNLTYQYPGTQHPVLKAINFHIQPAEKVAIIGPSGIGKTTLLKILLGLISPTTGNLLIDDLPLELLGHKKYRSVCASVMQDDSLISGSILDNITFLDNAINIDKVYEVSQAAQIHQDILSMPMGYETLIGDNGSSLSGGQKQRLLIARALYKNPRILFLDEATSHLDLATEITINAALKNLGITQVIIAHREESIKMADRIIALT